MRYFYSVIQKLKESYLRIYPRSYGEVLMFHQVDNNKENWIDYNVSITCDSFKKLIKNLVENGNKFGSIDELGVKHNKIYITFDDGFLDTYTNAYPVLKKYNIPFCIFITTNYINKDNYISSDILKILASEPLCTIGSHTLSHPLLRFKSNKDSYNEIYKSKCILEKYIEKKIKYFAYPYGSIYACSKKDIKNVYKIGYEMAFSTLNSHLSDRVIKYKFFIPRININEENYMNIRR